MKHINFILLLVFSVIPAFSQDEIMYSKDITFRTPIAKSKANYSRSTRYNDNGTISIKIIEISTGRVISETSYDDEEPFGTETVKFRKKSRILDYDFTLRYSRDTCSTGYLFYKGHEFSADDSSMGYIAPTVEGYKDVFDYLTDEIHYPGKAAANGWMGKVLLHFKITAHGNVEDVVIQRGAYRVIDKEAARVIRKLKLSSPPKIHGQAVDICVLLPVEFILSE